MKDLELASANTIKSEKARQQDELQKRLEAKKLKARHAALKKVQNEQLKKRKNY